MDAPGSSGPAVAPFLFSDPVLVDAEQSGAEPVTLVDRTTGQFFIQAVGSDKQGRLTNSLWRSDDQGLSFKSLGIPPAASEGALDGLASLTPRGSLLLSNSGAGIANMFRSTDHGDSWTPVALAQPGSHRTWLTSSKETTFYAALTLGGPSFVYASTDDGRTWSAPSKVRESSFDFGGPLVATQDGLLVWAFYVGQNVFSGGLSPGWYAMVSQNGATWRQVSIRGGSQNLGSTWAGSVADANGTIYLLWAEWGGDESWFNLMTTRDGLAWSEPVRLLAGKGARVLPWIATPAAGEIGIAWYGADGASDPESGARDWFAYYAKVVEADGTSPRVQAQKVSDASLHRGVVCPRGPLCPGGTRQLLDYTGIDYDAEGRARLAFAATVGHGLQSPRFGHPVAFAQT